MGKLPGKQSLPYLLSTSKTLVRCNQFYYDFYDFKFDCKRNREYDSETYARTNITRMWHNVVIPNCIISRDAGVPATKADALAALDYAMRHGKSQCAIDAYRRVLEAEAAKPEEERIWYKLNRSYYFYGLGMAAKKNKQLFYLPKSKRIDIYKYVIYKIDRYKRSLGKRWKCPWTDLNRIVNACIHWEDDYNAKYDELNAKIRKLYYAHNAFRWMSSKTDADITAESIADYTLLSKQEKEVILDMIRQRDELECPDFPMTYDDICKTFHCGNDTARRWKLFLKQIYKTHETVAINLSMHNSKEVGYHLDQYRRVKQEHKSILDTVTNELEKEQDEEYIVHTTEIDHDIETAGSSGERPEANWEVEAPLPF